MNQLINMQTLSKKISITELDLNLIDKSSIINIANKFISDEPFLDVFALIDNNQSKYFKNIQILFLSLIDNNKIDIDIYVDLKEKVIIPEFNDYTIPLSYILNSKHAFKFNDEIKESGMELSLIEKIMDNYSLLGHLFLEKIFFAYIK